MKQSKTLNNLILFILLGSAALLFILVLFSPGKLIYDERNFVSNIPLLEKFGLSRIFLNSIRDQSPGPLYQFIYYPLKYIGITTIKGYRVVNLLFLYAGILLFYTLIKPYSRENVLLRSLLIFAIPLTWTTGGLALTEIPTLFFALSSLAILRYSLYESKNQVLWFSVAGILLGFCIMGRTPFLVFIPATAFLFFKTENINKFAAFSYIVFSSIFPLILFFVWKGLVPPDVQHIQSGINFLFLAFTLSYTCAFMLIIYPSWYRIPVVYYKILGILLIALLIINAAFLKINFMPMKSLNKMLPGSFSAIFDYYISLLMPCIMICLSLLHIIALGYQVKYSKGNNWHIFLLMAATLVAFTTLKSAAQFSTRYPFQGFPFLLIYCAQYIKINRGLLVRILLGIAFGVISLSGFYHL